MRALLTTIGLTLTLSVGCQPAPTGDLDAYRAALPDERVKINLDTSYASGRSVGQVADAYLQAARVTDDVNAMIGAPLRLIDTIVAYPPSWSDSQENTALWGPMFDSLDAAETVLWVQHDDVDDTYTWAFAQRFRGSTSWDDFEAVIVGHVDAAPTEDDTSGHFTIDFDALASYDLTSSATGTFSTVYDLTPDGVVAEAGFADFSDGGGDPVTAYYAYNQDFVGNGQMDLVYYADVHNDGSALETNYVRTRWQADGSGRGDAAVGEGDLADFVGYQSECWDAAPTFGRTYYVNNWDPASVEGDVASCVYTDEDFQDGAAQ